MTIHGKKVNVTAYFDSGTFMHFGISNAQCKSYCSSETNIQSVYNLSDKDFAALSILITATVDSYLKVIE